MKITGKTIGLIAGLCAVFFFAFQAAAEPPQPPMPPTPPPGGPGGDAMDEDDDFSPHMPGHIAEMLGLTPDQLKKIQDLWMKAAEKITPLRAGIELKRAEAMYIWASGTPDKDKLLSKTREIARLFGEIMGVRTQMFIEIYGILTPEQRQMIIPLVAKTLEGHGGWHHKHPMMQPGMMMPPGECPMMKMHHGGMEKGAE